MGTCTMNTIGHTGKSIKLYILDANSLDIATFFNMYYRGSSIHK